MQLNTARLCLDCEELHDQQQCPVCASESFTYLTRWIPADERRGTRRPAKPAAPAQTNAVAQPKAMKWAKRGATGIAMVALGRWMWGALQPRDAEFDRK